MLRVKFGRFLCVVGRVVQVALRCMSVVSRSQMVPSFVMLRRFLVVLCGVFVVFGRLAMVFRCLLGHRVLSSLRVSEPQGGCAPMVKQI